MAPRSSRANPSDPRIPCPVCGQQIHPVAGRCKHCKTDLVKLRAQEGQRAPRIDLGAIGSVPMPAPSPVFAAPPPTGRDPGLPGPSGSNGHAAPGIFAPAPEVAPPPAFIAETVRVPGGTRAHAEGGLWSRRWPLIVAVLAGLAIIVCAYLLLFAGGDAKPAAAERSRGTVPAPDRMETMPAPPQVKIPDTADPWTQPAPPPAPVPSTPDLDPFDPLPPPSSPPLAPPSGGAAPPAEEFMGAMFETMCDQAKACGLDQIGVDACNALAGSGISDLTGEQIRAGRCTYDADKAARCLASIRGVPCNGSGTDLDDAVSVFLGFGDCTSALVCR